MKTQLREANAKEIRDMINDLRNSGKTFTHTFSNYTNTVQTDTEKIKWVKQLRSDKTFIAYQMIKQDIKANPLTEWICSREWITENYSNADFDDDLELPHIINIDISACYPNFLRLERLISEKTFSMLMDLPKDERLPAIGMIAYNRLKFMYKDGFLMNVVQEKSEFASVFFYIVQKVQDLFIKLKEECAQYYLFHWVDGIFLFPDIPQAKLKKIEGMIHQKGFSTTMESCRDFKWIRKNHVIHLDFLKGGELKQYKIRDVNYDDHFNQLVRSIHRDHTPARPFLI